MCYVSTGILQRVELCCVCCYYQTQIHYTKILAKTHEEWNMNVLFILFLCLSLFITSKLLWKTSFNLFQNSFRYLQYIGYGLFLYTHPKYLGFKFPYIEVSCFFIITSKKIEYPIICRQPILCIYLQNHVLFNVVLEIAQLRRTIIISRFFLCLF